MLGKRSRSSIIGRLSELLLLPRSSRSSLLDPYPNSHYPTTTTTTTTTLDNKTNCIIKNFDSAHLGGVGLGIVVALDKSSGSCGGTGPYSKYFASSPVGRRRSEPDDGSAEEEDEEEDYTYVTFHCPRVSFTMVYHDQNEKERREEGRRDVGRGDSYEQQGFLSSCQLCGKKLHGRDIYMYRGEKGFCSTECRSAQIMMDERSEQCRSEAMDSRGYSTSAAAAAFSEGQVLSTSIIAV